jgi:DNA polymerase III subunit chi
VAAPTRVDFYLLPPAEPHGRLKFACRLTEKVYKLTHRVHLHAHDANEANALDELLWTFRQGSFVPHELMTANTSPVAAAESPVTIGYGELCPASTDVVIDLAGCAGNLTTQVSRIADVVDGSEISRAEGRARYRAYQQGGAELTTHTIEGS